MAPVIAPSDENNDFRKAFFQRSFGDAKGYIGVAMKTSTGAFREAYFSYPDKLDGLLDWVATNVEGRELYFCPQLLTRPKRVKEGVSTCPSLWADLDEVDIDKVTPKPSIVLKTSESRYQALWVLDEPADPYTAEDASRRLAYSTKADVSGWDLTQLLRIPLTYNNKYDPVEIVFAKIFNHNYKISDFDDLEDVPTFKAIYKEFDPESVAGLDAEEILSRYRRKLLPHAFSLFLEQPTKDWSTTLWALESLLAEAGMNTEEMFAVAKASASNKYERDGRGDIGLWREVVKARASVDMQKEDEAPTITIGALLTDAERSTLSNLEPSFVDRYVAWAKARTDAAWQYHQAGALMILTTLLSDRVKLETSFGSVIPNLWIMILGDTTISRKTTSMEMAMDLLRVVKDDAILATDGSIEGILSALGAREGRTSLFWRDEFSGLIDSIQRRDYYTGMIEALTKLYDGKYLKRVLRRETIEIRNPVFVMYAGGIRSRILELISAQYILSGFVPRFVVFMGKSDLEHFQPIGPPTKALQADSDGMLDEIGKIQYNYSGTETIRIGDQIATTMKVYDAELTPEAWARYNEFETTMVETGVRSSEPDLYTPTLDRLSKSALKTAVLLAAARQEPPVVVDLTDVLRAIELAEKWVPNSVEVVQHAGKSTNERTLERAFSLIVNGKTSRAAVMKSMHLDSRETAGLLETLEQRGLIIRSKNGRSEKLYPTTSGKK